VAPTNLAVPASAPGALRIAAGATHAQVWGSKEWARQFAAIARTALTLYAAAVSL